VHQNEVTGVQTQALDRLLSMTMTNKLEKFGSKAMKAISGWLPLKHRRTGNEKKIMIKCSERSMV
jgi:hypothetical protein